MEATLSDGNETSALSTLEEPSSQHSSSVSRKRKLALDGDGNNSFDKDKTNVAPGQDCSHTGPGNNQGIDEWKAEIEQLSSKNKRLKDQLQNTLGTLVDMNQHFFVQAGGPSRRQQMVLTGVTGNCSNEEQSEPVEDHTSPSSNSPNLPTVVLSRIFENFQDTKTLLSCRLVCTSWKTVIDNTSAVMRKLTYRIEHPVLFLGLTNILHSTKSIKFDHTLPCAANDLEKMITAIESTVERVAFDFDMTMDISIGKNEQRDLVAMVLSRCLYLNELRILGTQKQYLQGLNFAETLLHIESLTIRALNKTQEDSNVFKELILGLPALSSLTLLGFGPGVVPDFEPVLSPVCEHTVKYPGVLKKLSYRTNETSNNLVKGSFGRGPGMIWAKLLLSAGKNGMMITTGKAFEFDLGSLLVFKETEEYTINEKNCESVTSGRLRLSGYNRLNQSRIVLCMNLKELMIHMNQDASPEKLDILFQLPKLIKLAFWSHSSYRSPEPLFLGKKLPQLRVLSIHKNAFSSTAIFSSLYLCFPNLVDLQLNQIEAPTNLLTSLSKLQRLEFLRLHDVVALTDTSFLSTFSSFKSLKVLNISKCHQLTDCCLLNGILSNNTLKKLIMSECRGFTEVGYSLITAGKMKVKTTSECPSHGHTLTFTTQ